MEKISKASVENLNEVMVDLQNYMDKKYPDLWDIIIYLENETNGAACHTFFEDTDGLVIAIKRIIGGDLEAAELLFMELGDMLVEAGIAAKSKYMDS